LFFKEFFANSKKCIESSVNFSDTFLTRVTAYETWNAR